MPAYNNASSPPPHSAILKPRIVTACWANSRPKDGRAIFLQAFLSSTAISYSHPHKCDSKPLYVTTNTLSLTSRPQLCRHISNAVGKAQCCTFRASGTAKKQILQSYWLWKSRQLTLLNIVIAPSKSSASALQAIALLLTHPFLIGFPNNQRWKPLKFVLKNNILRLREHEWLDVI